MLTGETGISLQDINPARFVTSLRLSQVFILEGETVGGCACPSVALAPERCFQTFPAHRTSSFSVTVCSAIGITAKIHDMSELKQEILQVLSELVEHCPDVRLGQLIVNLSCIARGPTPEAIWDMEDDELPRGHEKPPQRFRESARSRPIART